jgi:hypothetical protein
MMFVGAALPLNHEGLNIAARHPGVDPVMLSTVVVVETSGCGFLPDRRPTILFEQHIFIALGVGGASTPLTPDQRAGRRL